MYKTKYARTISNVAGFLCGFLFALGTGSILKGVLFGLLVFVPIYLIIRWVDSLLSSV